MSIFTEQEPLIRDGRDGGPAPRPRLERWRRIRRAWGRPSWKNTGPRPSSRSSPGGDRRTTCTRRGAKLARPAERGGRALRPAACGASRSCRGETGTEKPMTCSPPRSPRWRGGNRATWSLARLLGRTPTPKRFGDATFRGVARAGYTAGLHAPANVHAHAPRASGRCGARVAPCRPRRYRTAATAPKRSRRC